VEQSGDELEHLERLVVELAGQGLDARLVRRRAGSHVVVASPGDPALNVRVLCGVAADGGLCFWWPWRQPVGPVGELGCVAGKIMTVLRPVEGAG
jgi:hypothetical protein